MPEKGKLPEWERMDNKTKIFLKLSEKPLTFTELQKETGFSKSTLSQHLKSLQQQGAIIRTIEGNRIVYRTTLDEELLLSAYKASRFDFLLEMMSQRFPKEMIETIKILFRALVKVQIESKRREIEGKSPLSNKEKVKLLGECLESIAPPELRNFLQPTINALKNPTKETLGYFGVKE